MKTFLLSIDLQHSVLGRGRDEARAYSPYGALSNALVPRLAFCGQYLDPLTGSYPLGNGRRFYSPSLRRFISPDSVSPFGKGGINAYAYCAGDPVNRHDPSGKNGVLIAVRVGLTVSSATTATAAVVRTMLNVVKRKIDFKIKNGVMEIPDNYREHVELTDAARLSNQQFFATGVTGVVSHVINASTGNLPSLGTVADVFGVVNGATNLSGGLSGNYPALVEVVNYLKANPREIPGVFLETMADVTMLPDIINNVALGMGEVVGYIRSTLPRPYAVQT